MQAVYIKDPEVIQITTPQFGLLSGQVLQVPDGRAAYVLGLRAPSPGDPASAKISGQVRVPKVQGAAVLDGAEVDWSLTADAAAPTGDFFLGTAVGDYAGHEESMVVNLNVRGSSLIDLANGPFVSVPVGTQAAGGFGPPQTLGSALGFKLTATSEAQKVDALSVAGFAAGTKAVVDFALRIPSGGSGAAVDINLGLADDTHATNADTIAASVFVHLDGGSTALKVESDDGTHETVATDTTKTFTAGNGLANRVTGSIDLRNPADVKFYLGGERVLATTTFDVSAFTGMWKLLVHLEKTSGTETAEVVVDWLKVRTFS